MRHDINDQQIDRLHDIADTAVAWPHMHTHEDVDILDDMFNSGMPPEDYLLTLEDEQADTINGLLTVLDDNGW